MLSLAHTIMSLPLATHINNPLVIFISAIALHFLADMVFHWNLDPEKSGPISYIFIAADVLGGVVCAWLLLGPAFLNLNTWAGVAGANAPDVIHGIWFLMTPPQRAKWLGWANPFFRFHKTIQNETENIGLGLLPQIAAIATAVWLIHSRL